MATLTEIDNEWEYSDVLKANAVLDFGSAVSEEINEEANDGNNS